MSKIQQDSFTDDAEDCCPLCVEEFDLSDKGFRPCPCGYQICQFCYNNIKNNVNGLCPACRRPYDDQSVEWKAISTEEQKADIALQTRKKALARKKETEQKQAETTSRKNLAGIRVVQKNLVYVIGLTQQNSEEEFLKILRGDIYFGQYGRILKIVVSKPKSGSTDNAIGIYVTFERKDDAARCIAAVDGSKNLERTLRAQYGTTKYCSAYLRHETCNNRNCTFLHEVGEDQDSFSRQDLSSMNAMSSQRPQPPSAKQVQPPIQHTHSISQVLSRDDGPSQGNDTPALPSTANWAAKNAHTEAARASKPTSVSTSSPADSSVNDQAIESQPSQIESHPPPEPPLPEIRPRPRSPDLFDLLAKKIANANLEWRFDKSQYSEPDLQAIQNYPPLFSTVGGLKRYNQLKQQEQERMKQEEERNVIGAISTAEEDENLASGSLQLGGEPDTQDEPPDSARFNSQARNVIQPPTGSTNFAFGGQSARLPAQQQEALSRIQRTGSTRQSPIDQTNFYGQNSLHQHQTSNPFQNQATPNSFGQGHARQASRFTFSNDSISAIKPTANPQLSAQQAGVLPAAHSKFQNQFQSNAPNFYSSVQGPPPGLKSSGTPPISGGGMFGQGHGFASAMGGSNFKNDDQFLRSRDRGNSGQGPDFGKRPPRVPGPSKADVPSSTIDPTQAIRNRQGTPTPLPSAPEVTSAQDFPSLPTPSRPAAAPTAPASKKPSAPKAPATKLKPVPPAQPPTASTTEPDSVKADKPPSGSDARALEKVSEGPKTLQPGNLAPTNSKETLRGSSLDKHLEKAGEKQQPSQKMGPSQEALKDEADLAAVQAKELSTTSSSQPETPTKLQEAATPAPSGKKPKTLRVEAKALGKEASSAALNSPPASGPKETSRRASVGSTQQPATPSDSASFTTATLSRPSSPPAGRANTALPRNSKTQQKKDRQAKAKQVEAEKKVEQPPLPPEEPAIVQEPIIGRKKKKEKKPKVSKQVPNQTTTTASTPAPSRPPSPGQREPTPPLPSSSKDASQPSPAAATKAEDTQTDVTPTGDRDRPDLDIKELFASLLSDREIPATTKQIFTPVPSTTTRYESSSDLLTTPLPTLTRDQTKQLDSGIPIILPVLSSTSTSDNTNTRHTNDRVIFVQPSRRPLLGLTRPVAESLLDMAKRHKASGRTLNGFRELDPYASSSVPKLRVETSVKEIRPPRSSTTHQTNHAAAADNADDATDGVDSAAQALFDEEDDEDDDDVIDGEGEGEEGDDLTLTNAFASTTTTTSGLNTGSRTGGMNATSPFAGFDIPDSTAAGLPSHWGNNYPVMAAQAYAAAAMNYSGSSSSAAAGATDFPDIIGGGGRGMGAGGVLMGLSVEEAEQRFAMLRKETEVLEKKLNGVIRKNRKVVGLN